MILDDKGSVSIYGAEGEDDAEKDEANCGAIGVHVLHVESPGGGNGDLSSV